MGNPNGQAGSPNGQAGNPNGQQELPTGREKTTPDEGKVFDKDTVFVCVADCVSGGKRRRPGDTVTGRKCPPWFAVKPLTEKPADKKKDEK